MAESDSGRLPIKVLFVAGIGRSGSTLISRLAGQIPGTVGVGELRYLWERSLLNDRMCGCGLNFSSCPFWQDVGQRAFGGWKNVDAEHAFALRRGVERTHFVPALASGLASQEFRSKVAEYADLMARVYAAIRDVSGAEVVVDSSKYPPTAYLVRRAPGVSLRVVHLVRASQGVAYSWQKVLSRPDRDGKPLAQFPPSRSATRWDVYNVLLDCLAITGVPRILVRYEDFVSDPEPQLARMAALAGVSYDSLDFLDGSRVELRQDHSLEGNPMKFRIGWESLERDDEWKRAMAASSRRLVTALTAPGLLRYGYGIRELLG